MLLLLPIMVKAQQPGMGGGITQEEQETFDEILEPVIKIYNLIKYIATAIEWIRPEEERQF